MKLNAAVVALALVSVCAASGCRTKNNGRLMDVSEVERRELDCREIDIELAKCDEFIKAVEENHELDGRAVLSFLGDFGIGNSMERSEALESARNRQEQLQALKTAKACP